MREERKEGEYSFEKTYILNLGQLYSFVGKLLACLTFFVKQAKDDTVKARLTDMDLM